MSPDTPRSRPLRRARSAASLGAVGLLAVPLIGWSNTVAVTVDGDQMTTRTYAATVGDVLQQLDVPIGPADEVTPSPDTDVERGTTIDVSRAITVDVRVDDQLVRRIHAPVGSVAGVLTEAGMADLREIGADFAPRWTAPVQDGDTIRVSLPREVRVLADGEVHEVTTLTTTVGGVLTEQGLDLGDRDLVDWDLDAALQPHATISVARVTFDEVVVETVLPREVVRRETDDLRQGVTQVANEGRDGFRRDTFRVRYQDGEEVGRKRLDRQVRQPRDRVVLVGTYVPPPPPPRPAASSSSSGTPSDVWDRLARCESGGNWQARGRYHGGLQFHPQTWNAYKPGGYPQYAYDASREQQIEVGKRVQRSQGWEAWPHCSRAIGVR